MKAFGAVEKRRAPGPDGKSIMHADLRIGDSTILLNDEFPEMGALSPLASNMTPVTLHLSRMPTGNFNKRCPPAPR